MLLTFGFALRKYMLKIIKDIANNVLDRAIKLYDEDNSTKAILHTDEKITIANIIIPVFSFPNSFFRLVMLFLASQNPKSIPKMKSKYLGIKKS